MRVEYMRQIILQHQDPCPFQCSTNEGKMSPWPKQLVPVSDVLLLFGLFDEGQSWLVEGYQ